jgi:hypothetical protein
MLNLKMFVAAVSAAALMVGCAPQNQKVGEGNEIIVVSKKQSLPQEKPQGAVNFTSRKAGFSIYFPVKPTENITEQKTEWGTHETMVFQSETAPVTYIVFVITIPPSVDTSDPERFLNGVEKGLLEESKAKVLKHREFNLQGMPSRELHTSLLDGKALSRNYICFKPNVTYQIMAVAMKDEFKKQQKQIDKVFKSFRSV